MFFDGLFGHQSVKICDKCIPFFSPKLSKLITFAATPLALTPFVARLGSQVGREGGEPGEEGEGAEVLRHVVSADPGGKTSLKQRNLLPGSLLGLARCPLLACVNI